MEIKEIAVKVAHGELSQTPRLLFERSGDEGASGCQFTIQSVDIFGEDPVYRGLKERHLTAKEDDRITADDGSDFLVRIGPANVEAEAVLVMLLSKLHVSNGQLRDGPPDGTLLLVRTHEMSLREK
jgi:hypothetical protein